MACKILSNSVLLLGRCVPSLKKDSSKILVKTLEFDENLNMYFKRSDYLFAHDPDKVCKTGDVVLIEKLPERLTKLITHKVLEVVYPYGDVTDPITGEKVVAGNFRYQLKEKIEKFGAAETAFDYEKAPPRGYQEDKRDFTHKETYTRYHIFGNDDQPDAV